MQAMDKALQNLANPMEMNVTNIKQEKAGVVNEGFLRDTKKDQRNFARRDAANLFGVSALANDKDGKSTEREMSLPSAFFSRGGGLEDSAHAVLDLSDTGSEEAQVNQRANRSWSVSRPLGSDRSFGSESERDRDYNPVFLGDCATEDLDLVENAILRLLREDGRSSSKPHNKDSTKLKDALGLDEHLEGSEQSAGSVDLQLLSRLLDQVQTLREQRYQHRQVGRTVRSLSRGRSVWDVTKQGGKEKRFNKDDMKKAAEAATQAAKSAADAAKSASSLVTKHSEVVGKLLQSLRPSTSKASPKKQENKTSSDDPDHSGSSSSDSEGSSSDYDDLKAIAKRIVSQNRYTHVVLGIMLVSSFVWRYIVVKVVKRVKNKVSDPWGYVEGMLTDNFEGLEKVGEKEKADSSEEHSNGLSMPHLDLSPFLNSREQRQGRETSTDDVKEEQVLSFGNFLQSKLNNNK